MKIGIYIRNIEMINDIPESVMEQVDCITCGDYGCPKNLPHEEEVLLLNENLKKQNKALHYISPKLSQPYIESEYKRVIAFMNKGIGISINDWGLLYKIRPLIKEQHDIYIGRLLTKSIADWTWSMIFLKDENDQGRKYLTQNNFNHKRKIDYFKSWGVKGIEVSVNNVSEDSYKSIYEQGMDVIGFADNSILALARACPVIKIEKSEVCTKECREICGKELYHLVPKRKDQEGVYPKIRLSGNVVFGEKHVTPNWNSYKRVMYTWGMSGTEILKDNKEKKI